MSAKTCIAAAVVGTVLGAGTLASAATNSTPDPETPATTESAAPCDDENPGAWPPVVQGRPESLDAGDRGGVYLWHGTDGWRLAVTHRGDAERTYSGTISTSGRIRADGVREEDRDKIKVLPGGHTLVFRFTNYGHPDGVRFRTMCAPSLSVSVRGDGQQLPPNRVYLGTQESSPTSNPFRIERA